MSASGSSSNSGPDSPPAWAGALSDQHSGKLQGGEAPLPKPWHDPSMETTKSLSVISEYITGLSLPRKATHAPVDQYLNLAGEAAELVSPEMLSTTNEGRYIRNKSSAVGYGDQYICSLCEACITLYWTTNQDNTKTKLAKEQVM